MVGTDEPVYTSLLPGFAFHRELLAMVHAGLPPVAVLKAARNVTLVIKTGEVYDPTSLLESAVGKIGPSDPDDHADWELTIRPLR